MREGIASRLEQGKYYLQGIGAFLLALGCARAWVTLVFAAPAISADVDLNAHRFFDYAYCLVSIVVALNARRLAPLAERRWVGPSAACCMLGATAASMFAALGSPSTELVLLGAVLGGLGFGLFLLIWAEALNRLSIMRVALFISLSQVFAVVLVYFCQGMSHDRLVMALAVLPVIALFAVSRASRTESDFPVSKVSIAARIPWKLIALMAVYSLAYGLRESRMVEGAGVYSSVSTGIVMLLFFGVVFFFSDRIGVSALYKSAPLLMLCGVVLIPSEGIVGNEVSSYLMAMGYSLMSLLIALLIYDISRHLGMAIVVLAGWKNAMQVFVVWGGDAAHILETTPFPPALQQGVVTAAVVVLIFVAMFILFSEKEFTSKWGARMFEASALSDEGAEDARRVRRCDELSATGKLSPREDEILRLYAQGKNGPSIERELFIAEGTLKTHTRHIYEKLGVSSRKELYDLLGVDGR